MKRTARKTRKLASNSKPKAPDSKIKKKSRDLDMATLTNRLLADIRSLQFAWEEVLKSLGENAKKKAEALSKFIEKHSSHDEGSDKRSIEIPVEKTSEFSRQLDDVIVSLRSVPLSLNGLFLVLVSKWDAYIGSVLRWLYAVQPDIINGSGRSILYTDLREINDLAAAREKIVDDEISAVLRESHVDHFEYLEKKLGITLTKDLDIWPQFVELTQRRHLVAHTDGRVSQQYLKNCAAVKASANGGVPAVGAELKISPSYFLASCGCLTELGFKLSQVLWRKLQPGEVSKADGHLIRTTFEMIVAGQYDAVIKILEFSLKPPMKFDKARDRMTCIINLAQAFKWCGKNEKCLATLNEQDWTGTNVDFRLIVAVLKDEFDEAAKLMKQLGSSDDIKKQDFTDWPVFREFRKTSQFLKAYREVFNTEVEVRDVPQDVTSILSHVSKKERSDKGPQKRQRRR